MKPLTLSQSLDVIAQVHPDSDTPRWYRQPVNDLIAIAGDVPVRSVTREQIDLWWEDVKGRRLSRWTLNSYVRAMKAFWNHMVRLHHAKASPADHLKVPRPPKGNPKDISDGDVALLVKKARRSARDYALVLTLRDTGCRMGGLVSMTTDTLDIRRKEDGTYKGRILVTEKGDKPRYVYLKDESSRAMLNYLESRPVDAPPDLWLARGGEPLTRSGVYHVLRSLARQAGVDRFNPHAFRHRFCKRLVAKGASPKVIQDIMGWDSPRMVDTYVIHTPDELQEYHERYT